MDRIYTINKIEDEERMDRIYTINKINANKGVVYDKYLIY